MNPVRRYLDRVARGPLATRWLQRAGINPVHYWLLMDLFGQLSERREVLSQLGRDSASLKMASWIYFGFSGLLTIPFVLMGQKPVAFLATFLAIGAFMLLSLLLPETSNSLVNPVEGLVLSHQPIDGATYTAAKLSHILMILLYLVPGLNLIPAFAGLLLQGCPWYYPLVHMVAAFGVGIVLALSCCALFGWLIRFVAPARLKAVGFIAEMTPWLFYMLFQFSGSLHVKLRMPRWLPTSGLPLAVLLATLGLLSIAAVVLGLRSLSGDYLARVSAIAHGGSGTKSKVRPSRLGEVVALLGGGPPARAGFDYLSRMMRRDWHFRRQMISLIPMSFFFGLAVFNGVKKSPFAGKFSEIHLLPHLFGFAFFVLCSSLVYGRDYKGVWIFLLAPAGAFHGFARGVYSRLLLLIAVPHAILLPVLAGYWGARDAVLFVGYSLAVAAVYLGLELRLIEGLPFSQQPRTAANAYLLPLMLVGGLAMGVVVALQYFLLFHSPIAVLVTTVVLGVGAWLLTRSSLDTFEINIRFNLGLISNESKGIYTEVA